METKTDFILYSSYRSSCSARLRLALNMKGLMYDYAAVDTFGGEQYSKEHEQLNPSRSVPVLVSEEQGVKIGQSVAALEYLEEKYPNNRPLLPSDPIARAHVRSLVNIIVCDVQPLTNTRTIKAVDALKGDTSVWSKQWTERGLAAFEGTCKEKSGKFSFGDEVTLADVCLIPAVWNAEIAGVDLSAYPTVNKIFRNFDGCPDTKASHWRNQPDTPEEHKR